MNRGDDIVSEYLVEARVTKTGGGGGHDDDREKRVKAFTNQRRLAETMFIHSV